MILHKIEKYKPVYQYHQPHVPYVPTVHVQDVDYQHKLKWHKLAYAAWITTLEHKKDMYVVPVGVAVPVPHDYRRVMFIQELHYQVAFEPDGEPKCLHLCTVDNTFHWGAPSRWKIIDRPDFTITGWDKV